ncbi:MAG TPA: sarcinarray family MAST domain-containing protein [Methanocella sp.]|jgi:sarcinarray family protein
MKKLLTLLLLALFLAALPGETYGRSIKAYFNGQEATVSGIVLRPGERFTVDLNVTPDNEADVWAEIDEPGTSRAYDRLDGDELMPTEFKRCNVNTGARFHWVLAANGNWLNGTAPVNIYYQINGRNSNEVYASGYFTVVEAYITPEAAVAGTAGTDKKNSENVPGPGVIVALAGTLIALLIRRTAS